MYFTLTFIRLWECRTLAACKRCHCYWCVFYSRNTKTQQQVRGALNCLKVLHWGSVFLSISVHVVSLISGCDWIDNVCYLFWNRQKHLTSLTLLFPSQLVFDWSGSGLFVFAFHFRSPRDCNFFSCFSFNSIIAHRWLSPTKILKALLTKWVLKACLFWRRNRGLGACLILKSALLAVKSTKESIHAESLKCHLST